MKGALVLDREDHRKDKPPKEVLLWRFIVSTRCQDYSMVVVYSIRVLT